jgi:hypothetical protein
MNRGEIIIYQDPNGATQLRNTDVFVKSPNTLRISDSSFSINLHNPNSKPVEFDGFRMQAGLPSPIFNYGEFDTIKSKAGSNNFVYLCKS